MNAPRKSMEFEGLQTPYRRLSQRLDEAAEREGWTAHAEQIEALGKAMFGDLWKPRSTPTEQFIATGATRTG